MREGLAEATDVGEVGRLLFDEARRRIGVSGFCFFPLSAGPQDVSRVIMVSEASPSRRMLSRFVELLPAGKRDLGTIEQLLARHERTIDFNRTIAASRLERLEVYNEFWRPFRVERQVVGFMGTPEEPLGFVGVFRRPHERPFAETHRRKLELLRRAGERALGRLTHPAGMPLDLRTLLGALETGLPVACALFDTEGRLQWMSREALARFESRTVRFGRARVVPGSCVEFDAWRRAAVLAAREGGRDPETPHLRVEAPGATRPVLVRRLEPEHGRPLILVSAVDRPASVAAPARPEDLGRYRLTQREAQVAVLAARGFSALNVAARLGVAEATVRTHMKNLYRKMEVSNRAALADRVLGAVLGMTDPPGPAGPGAAPPAPLIPEPPSPIPPPRPPR